MKENDRFVLASGGMAVSSLPISIGLRICPEKDYKVSAKWYNLSREAFSSGSDGINIDDFSGTQRESNNIQGRRNFICRTLNMYSNNGRQR
jgi:hypothetical protein